MRTITKGAAPALVLASIVFFGVWACQPQDEARPKDPVEETSQDLTEEGELHEVEFFDEVSDTGDFVTRRVKKINAKQGDRVRFTAANRTLWVLIPRAMVNQDVDGTDWAQGDSFIAFKIDHGSATIKIQVDYPAPEEGDEFAYSILVLKNGVWSYDYGESPPRMIIRPR